MLTTYPETTQEKLDPHMVELLLSRNAQLAQQPYHRIKEERAKIVQLLKVHDNYQQ